MRAWFDLRGVLAAVCCLGLVVALSAQEEKARPKGPESKEAEPKPTESKEKPEAKAPTSSGPKSDAFNKLLGDWKTLLKDLRKLRSDYASSKEGTGGELVKQWDELVAKGNTMLPELRAAAKEAYEEGSQDPQIERLMLKFAQDAVDSDDYETAWSMSKAMLDRAEKAGAPAPKELYNIAGVSAFATNDFDSAEKYLTLAKESGTLKDLGNLYIAQIPKFRGYWEKEKEVEAKEAKEDDLPRVKISTSAGDMVIELFENQAPETVANFISLVEAGFYKNTGFHRVLKNFMAQGGDPKGDGTGGPGYTIFCETDKPDYRRHFRGTLSMAHAGKDTGGSQFFICFNQQEGLDGKHTAFGRVVEGLDVLAKIQRRDPMGEPPLLEPTKILGMEVLRKRDHAYTPRRVE